VILCTNENHRRGVHLHRTPLQAAEAARSHAQGRRRPGNERLALRPAPRPWAPRAWPRSR